MRSLMMFVEASASRCALSHEVSGVLGVTVRSLMMFDEFWASPGLSHDV